MAEYQSPPEWIRAFASFREAIEQARVSIARLGGLLQGLDDDHVLGADLILEDVLDAEVIGE